MGLWNIFTIFDGLLGVETRDKQEILACEPFPSYIVGYVNMIVTRISKGRQHPQKEE